jgi:hypothetical protein
MWTWKGTLDGLPGSVIPADCEDAAGTIVIGPVVALNIETLAEIDQQMEVVA